MAAIDPAGRSSVPAFAKRPVTMRRAVKSITMIGPSHDGGGESRRACRFCLWLLLLLAPLAIPMVEPSTALATDIPEPTVTAWQRGETGRLSIEWPGTTRVRQKKSDEQLILRFSSPISVDLVTSVRDISSFVDPERTSVNGNDLILSLRPGTIANVKIRDRRIVTVDFSREPETDTGTAIDVSSIENGIRLTFRWPGPTHVGSLDSPDELRLTTTPGREIAQRDLYRLERTLQPWFSAIRTNRGADERAIVLALKPDVTSSVRSEGDDKTIVDLIRDASLLPASPASESPADWEKQVFVPEARPDLSGDPTSPPSVAGPPIPIKRPTVLASLPMTDGQSESADADGPEASPAALVFPWRRPVGAAVFMRAGHLWAVFDEPDIRLLGDLPRPPAGLGEGSLVQAAGGTAARYPMETAFNIHVTRTKDGHWQIEPTSASTSPQPVTVKRIPASDGLHIGPVPGNRIVDLADPTVGDRIHVLPLMEPGPGQPSGRRFVDLELLSTAQGVAWRPLNDRLSARLDGQTLAFSMPEGLALSGVERASSRDTETIIEASARKREEPDKPVAVPFERPSPPESPPSPPPMPESASAFGLAGTGVDRLLMPETRRVLRQAISRAPAGKKDEARLALARLLVSERLASEARTVLAAIDDDAQPSSALQKHALLGAAAFLIGRPGEASKLLTDPKLDDDDEIGIWRAALASRDNNWPTAAEDWRSSGDLLDTYPPRLKVELGLLAVEAGIETNDETLLRTGFTRLESLPMSALDEARVETMRALKTERSGDLDQARSMLQKLASSPFDRIRILAESRLTALNIRDGAPQDDALAPLNDRLSLWRGHPQERDMFDRTARSLGEADAFRQALQLWRELIERQPDMESDDALQQARQALFIRALTDDTNTAFDVADPYAIYLDFNDLVPDNSKARVVNRHLAQHLTDLDLADQAIAILRGLMDSSTTDVERAEIGLELAALLLQERRPKEALIALQEGPPANRELPAPLLTDWQLARARSLAALERLDDALLVIQDLQSQPARRLRADIFWQARNWPRLTAAIDSYFSNRETGPPLTEDEQQLVLWLALASERTGPSDQLQDLRDRFGSAMRAGAYAETFDVATQAEIATDDIQTLLTETERQLAELRRFREAAGASP